MCYNTKKTHQAVQIRMLSVGNEIVGAPIIRPLLSAQNNISYYMYKRYEIYSQSKEGKVIRTFKFLFAFIRRQTYTLKIISKTCGRFCALPITTKNVNAGKNILPC